MDARLEDRRSCAFSRVIAATTEDAEVEAVQAPVLQQFRAVCRRALSETPLTIAVLALATLAVLLVVRPPFVLRFEQDQRRPWRGTTSLSWSSVAVTVFLVALAPLVGRFVLAKASPLGGTA